MFSFVDTLVGLAVGLTAGLILGVILLYGYQVWRIHRNNVRHGGDPSNIGNAQNILTHVVLHGEDFGQMQYPDGSKPFWYVYEDLFKGILKTRPPR